MHNSKWQFQAIRFFSLVLVCSAIGVARGEVRFFDGFGDGDLNNDGIILGAGDADLNLDETVGNGYEPPEFLGVTVNELTAALDPSDTGIAWHFTRGWTSPPSFSPKGNIKLIDDSAGMLPDSMHPTHPVPALDSGHAVSFDSKGRGSSMAGFFGEQVALGPEVGDQVKVSFDYRTWLSASVGNSATPPRVAALRFGLFQDTDNQLGTVNPFAGRPDDATGIPTAATWGEEGGHFRGDFGTVGANEDHGWYTAIDLGREDFTGEGAFLPVEFGGINARINEEINDSTSGGRFLEGSDADFVARTDELAPTFTALDVTKTYNLALTLERATDVTAGDTIKAIFTVTDLASGMEWTLEGTEPLADSMGMADGVDSDAWDYFAIRNTTPIGDSDGEDFDFIMDNFMLEVFGSNASDTGPDFNGDMSVDCADVDALVAEIVAGTNGSTFDLNGDNSVDGSDLTEWLAQAGAINLANGNSYLVGDANLDGTVDGLDFIEWNNNKFTSTPAWCSGDFNADGSVDGLDFIEWNDNKFTSSDAIAGVPEPSSLALVALFAVFGLRLRKAS